MRNYCLTAAMCMAVTTPCAAATSTATAATIAGIFASAKPGDLITLSGEFAGLTLADRDFGTTGIKIGAWGATFRGTVNLRNLVGVSWRGGSFAVEALGRTQRAMSIYKSARIIIDMPSIGGDGGGQGIIAQSSSAITVKNGSYRQLRIGIGYTDIATGTISGNVFTAMSSDGINITGASSRVTASANRCQLPEPSEGAHPDCIQLWSDTGKPQLRDITLTNNRVYGATQGINLFDRGGVRIVITNNIVATSYPQGIACYLCDASRITGNVVTTEPGARWRTMINGTGVGLVISGNSVGLKP
ncbi:hypothetical protein IP88_13705 [alpha proteobacterium AAP81b]|nr:hypothetical protein IP88_13705 [alpha proteobacterium AAP81b]